MTAQRIICHSLVVFCVVWISLGEPQIKGKVFNNKLEVRRNPQECVGNCRAGGQECSEPCKNPFHGNKTFVCLAGQWQKSTETCSSLDVQSLLQRISKPRIVAGKPEYEMHHYSSHSSTTRGEEWPCPMDFSCIIQDILSAPPVAGNIVDIVKLLRSISINLSTNVTIEKLMSFSKMADRILNGSLLPDWAFISEKNASCVLLESVISFAGKLRVPQNVSNSFIATKCARINKNTLEKSFTFSLGFNNSKSNINGTVSLPPEGLRLLSSDSQAISVALPTLGPIIETTLLKNISVNGMVLSVTLPEVLKEVSLRFEKMNKTENLKSQCVAWHSKNQKWDGTACDLQEESSAVAICRCKHQPFLFQSFSILMSQNGVKNAALHTITCVGLVVSICSLVLCLAIEMVVWHQITQTQISYMRHICLVNIAVSLLVADVLFIVAAFVNNMPRNHNTCVAATFFVHFFYLALFFWMLALGLLILYGLLVIFWHLRKSTLLVAAFGIGYGCPLVIALLTVMITEPRKGYLREGACWLNWHHTKALLAFIIPALLIIGINLIVVLVVIARSGRSSVGNRSKPQDLVTVIRVSKNVALLTPLLGLTWGFGLATVVNDASLALHVTFSLLNAFQGFFILLFGTLLDRKTRESLRMKFFPSKIPSPDTTCGHLK
ncbi:adhesion G protein-coupled receptor F4 isoform X2 [Eublepharis macularius]|uniref:Adhesion G protein-coupled receptor F4 isoform X2 n=1 Tax=Eublepharis macularius TaxID=481883 RepID=A0AA97LIQ1_EUBMA|nr:adhesion G protein-coupled receptor F4 isoform X2 [Eublepharis macularius]